MHSEPKVRASALCLLVAFLFAGCPVAADCLTDLRGNVYCGAGQCVKDRGGKTWCSKHYEGGARTTIEGQVLCGRGKCAKDKFGRICCSTEIGGSVLVDRKGQVYCFGRCEAASTAHCESTPAGKSPEDQG